jgi:UDP-GlcNAc:undecaprenyl-phosphate GlcNAc-1-phosphate transferase
MPLHVTHFMNAFLLAVVLILVLEKAAWSVGLVDRPNSRKLHDGGVPVIGGLAIFCAFVLTVLLISGAAAPWPLLVGLAVLVGLGVVDDLIDLRAPFRLTVQVGAALLILLPGGHLIEDLGNLLGNGHWELGIFALPFTLIFVVGLINAFNMLDGLDGLAGGVAASAFFWLAVGAALAGRGEQVLLLVLLFSTLGFLVFNLRHPWQARARVFMGDAGSTMLGAGIAVFILAAATGPGRLASLPAWLFLCALPAIDTLSLIARRLLAGQSPMVSDRRHLHHLILKAGLSERSTAAVLVLSSFALGGIGVGGALLGVPDGVMVLGLVALVGLHSWFVRHDWRVVRREGVTAAEPPLPALPQTRPVRKRIS